MSLDPTLLARIQFGFTVSFHIIFPTMSIGLAMFLAVVEGLWLKTKDPLYLQIYRFWLSIFAMGFGVGVVTGIVLSFEFGLGFAKIRASRRPRARPHDRIGSPDLFLSGGGFPGDYAFRIEPRRSPASLRLDLPCRIGDHALRGMDSLSQ